MGKNEGTYRVTIRVTKEMDSKIREWAKKLALSNGQLAGVALMAGMDKLIMAISPVDGLSDDQLKRVFQVTGVAPVKQDLLGSTQRAKQGGEDEG